MTDNLKIKLRSSYILFGLFIIFSVIALIGPRWGTGYVPFEYRRGLDIVFAIDVSRSMDIRDTQASGQIQSRLERGLGIARDSITSISGARYAAAIGRSRGYLAVPLTYDNEAALIFLESLDGSSMTGRSTNLESLIEAAAEAFQNTSAARKVIVLISDGESHAGVLRNAINRCIKEGIIVNTVAAGSDEGRKIETQSDAQNNSAVSRRDASVMRTSAERTGGIYIDAGREDASYALCAHLLSLAQETSAVTDRREPKQQRTFFIILALISYCASKFITRQTKMRKLPLASIIAILLFSSCADGKLLLVEANYLHSRGRYDEAAASYLKALDYEEAAPYAQYGLGLTYYSLDQMEAAHHHYENSKKILETLSENEHRELRYRNYYNSGIILFEEGEFRSAADAFKEALRADPKKIEAKRNLELSLLSISLESNTNNRNDTTQAQREILFDYLREEEQQLWRSREWAPEDDFTGADY